MRGESHIAMNLATGGIIAGTCVLLENIDIPEDVKNIVIAVKDFFLDSGDMIPWLYLPLCVVLFMLGGLLPDVDTPYSLLGRIIYLPFEHRTWTHAIYLPLGLIIGGIWVRPLMWLGIGVFCHDFWDSLSASGVNWFYPYKRKGQKMIKLYHTGQASEYVLSGVVFTLTVIYMVIVFQIAFDIFGKIGIHFV